jgi:CheY-like chemotaxis protein
MGGHIEATSVLGAGSIFIIVLPLRAAPAAHTAEPHELDGTSAPTTASMRILAAEDNPINQLVLRTLLGQFGLEVEIVSDGLEAVQAWRLGAFDVVLMDMQMPRMDGVEATRLIRREETALGRPRTPIIALTANAMTHQVNAYTAQGMDGFVAKPIDIQKLLDALTTALSPAQANVALSA